MKYVIVFAWSVLGSILGWWLFPQDSVRVYTIQVFSGYIDVVREAHYFAGLVSGMFLVWVYDHIDDWLEDDKPDQNS